MYGEIAANKRKTVFLMAGFFLFVAGLAAFLSYAFGHPTITPYVIAGLAVYVLISYFSGSRMALAVNGAREIQKSDNPRLWRIVENLSITNGMPMPKVYIMNDPAPNAFATGRDPNHAAVCATTGILEIMTDSELEGVMAHELGHVKNYDIRVSMIAFALVAAVSLVADIILHMTFFNNSDDDDGGVSPIFIVLGIVAAIVAPLIAAVIQLAISRKREYLADATGALTTRYPEGLASALEKIGQYGSALQKPNASTAHLFFSNPMKSKGLSTLFATHPPLADRVNRLRSMTSVK